MGLITHMHADMVLPDYINMNYIVCFLEIVFCLCFLLSFHEHIHFFMFFLLLRCSFSASLVQTCTSVVLVSC